MGTRTIGLDDEAYERLDAIKREGESFSDAVKRITESVSADWRRSFGKYAGERGERLEAAVSESRSTSAAGLTSRQEEALATMSSGTEEPSDGDSTTGDER